MSEPKGLYPHGTPDNQAVPFEVERPLGLIIQPFTGAASALVDLPSTEDYTLALYSSVLCVVSFGAVAPALTAGAFLVNCCFVPPGFVISASPDPSVKKTFSVRSADGATAGTLYLQVIQRWSGLNVPVASRRS